jgi:hypothetical protein
VSTDSEKRDKLQAESLMTRSGNIFCVDIKYRNLCIQAAAVLFTVFCFASSARSSFLFSRSENLSLCFFRETPILFILKLAIMIPTAIRALPRRTCGSAVRMWGQRQGQGQRQVRVFLCSSSGSSSDSGRSRHPDFDVAEDFEKKLDSIDIFSPFKFVSNILFSSSFSSSSTSESEGGADSDKELLKFVGSRHVLSELQHPLLLRHGFDALDFIAGARLAHARVLESLHAQDLRHFLDGHVRQGPAKAFLEEVCSPEALQSFLDHADSGHGGEERAGRRREQGAICKLCYTLCI